MRKVSERIISVFLVLVMLFVMIPAGAVFASAHQARLL